MHDINWIRENPEAFDEKLKARGAEPQSAAVLALDEKRRARIAELQAMQEKRNAASKLIGQAKQSGDESRASELMGEVSQLKSAIQQGEEDERTLEAEMEALVAAIPNLPLDGVPEGADENDNVELHKSGEKPALDFEPKQHFELGEALGLMDFDTATKLSGARFVVLKGALARLERSIAQYMLDTHTQTNGYTEVNPPLMVRDEVMYGTGQLPKFADDQFRTEDGRWLIPTAEVPLTNLVRESIIEDETLPRRYTAYTPCFRLEAGAAGRDTRGMIRQHQFSKVELVSVTRPEESLDELERMRECAEGILKGLGLHYRVVTLCTGDMGFGARKTYDIEVWLPGQDAYREISSCSVCGDFQARRMNARYRPKDAKKPAFVHTLNGSGLAVGRTLVAVLENYQNADGSITIPDALQPYMGGLKSITAAT
ncbi:serine--tRNA ligase [Tepidamorphus sp. 3E244]|uniref:serine--tRNA ligase n=1 Tax=Tepidamorphus sp. 3E244 TaxID=3385498 RepID=UPI0038FCC976